MLRLNVEEKNNNKIFKAPIFQIPPLFSPPQKKKKKKKVPLQAMRPHWTSWMTSLERTLPGSSVTADGTADRTASVTARACKLLHPYSVT